MTSMEQADRTEDGQVRYPGPIVYIRRAIQEHVSAQLIASKSHKKGTLLIEEKEYHFVEICKYFGSLFTYMQFNLTKILIANSQVIIE